MFSKPFHRLQYNFGVLRAENGSRHTCATRRTWYRSPEAEISWSSLFFFNISEFICLPEKRFQHFCQALTFYHGNHLGQNVRNERRIISYFYIKCQCTLQVKVLSFLKILIFILSVYTIDSSLEWSLYFPRIRKVTPFLFSKQIYPIRFHGFHTFHRFS